MSDVVLELPDDLRHELREPFGSLYTDVETLLADEGDPLVAVGDIVTYHLLEAGHRPTVSIVDGKTKRERVERDVLDAIEEFDGRIDVANPQSTITDDLLEAIATALADPEPTVVVVDGEEDLASLPAVLAVPDGGSVVYGQPEEGMVLVPVDPEVRERCRTLIGRMQSDLDRIESVLSP